MAITPGRLIALILLFHTRQAVLTSLTFVGGMATNMLIEGLAFALIFSLTGVFTVEEGSGFRQLSAVYLDRPVSVLPANTALRSAGRTLPGFHGRAFQMAEEERANHHDYRVHCFWPILLD